MFTGKQTALPEALKNTCITPFLEAPVCRTRWTYPGSIQCVPLTASSEDEEYGIHGSTVINAFTVSTGRMIGFVLRYKREHFLPKLIAYPLLAACHIFTLRDYQLRHSDNPDNPFWDRFLGCLQRAGLHR